MIENYGLAKSDSIVTVLRTESRPITLLSGDVMMADVLDVIESGMVMLRITPPPGKGAGVQGGVVTAKTNVPLNEGDKVVLEVLGSGKEVKFRYLGTEKGEQETGGQETPTKTPLEQLQLRVFSLLSELSDAKLQSEDLKTLKAAFDAIPVSIKSNYPEFSMFSKFAPDIEQIDANLLKSVIEGAGVLFESKLKTAVMQEIKQAPDVLLAKETLHGVINVATLGLEELQGLKFDIRGALNTIVFKAEEGLYALQDVKSDIDLRQLLNAPLEKVELALQLPLDGKLRDSLIYLKQRLLDIMQTHDPIKQEQPKTAINFADDQKALLFRLQDVLSEGRVADILKYSVGRKDDIPDIVERLIKHIEYFQVSSKANDMVYSFLPFSWQGLRDGEMLFKKNKYSSKKTFTCDINLNLRQLGKLSISATLSDRVFFISFHAERPETKDLIAIHKYELERRFEEVGLSLKVINVAVKEKIDFAEAKNTRALDLVV
ncbi:flagellar hook-length control protein FliK [Candidatus Magnetobacterium casense]|uniref:flagellar hook-length control protein FliK n=1 Tax=Candidatus Magnetobacterium casense TaxID=1455061 RepID=UPI0009DEC5A4|nr:flagellar hook-length control protein FliK [Candidatus Magnetobacterium casensis]